MSSLRLQKRSSLHLLLQNFPQHSKLTFRLVSSGPTKSSKGKIYFNWKDALNLRDQLTEEERMIQDSANKFVDENLVPRF